MGADAAVVCCRLAQRPLHARTHFANKREGICFALFCLTVFPFHAICAYRTDSNAVFRSPNGIEQQGQKDCFGEHEKVSCTQAACLRLHGGSAPGFADEEDFDPVKLKEIGAEVLKMWEVSEKESKREEDGEAAMEAGKDRITDVSMEEVGSIIHGQTTATTTAQSHAYSGSDPSKPKRLAKLPSMVNLALPPQDKVQQKVDEDEPLWFQTPLGAVNKKAEEDKRKAAESKDLAAKAKKAEEEKQLEAAKQFAVKKREEAEQAKREKQVAQGQKRREEEAKEVAEAAKAAEEEQIAWTFREQECTAKNKEEEARIRAEEIRRAEQATAQEQRRAEEEERKKTQEREKKLEEGKEERESKHGGDLTDEVHDPKQEATAHGHEKEGARRAGPSSAEHNGEANPTPVGTELSQHADVLLNHSAQAATVEQQQDMDSLEAVNSSDAKSSVVAAATLASTDPLDSKQTEARAQDAGEPTSAPVTTNATSSAATEVAAGDQEGEKAGKGGDEFAWGEIAHLTALQDQLSQAKVIVSELSTKRTDAASQLAELESEVRRQQQLANDRLWAAAAGGDVQEIRKLTKLGAQLDEGDANLFGRSALHLAAYHGRTDAVRVLVELGASLNVTSVPLRWTALHYAAQRGQNETVKALLELGADPSQRNDMGKVPHTLAELNGHRWLSAYLRNHSLARRKDVDPEEETLAELTASLKAAGLSDVNATLQATVEREQQRRLERELRKRPAELQQHPGAVLEAPGEVAAVVDANTSRARETAAVPVADRTAFSASAEALADGVRVPRAEPVSTDAQQVPAPATPQPLSPAMVPAQSQHAPAPSTAASTVASSQTLPPLQPTSTNTNPSTPLEHVRIPPPSHPPRPPPLAPPPPTKPPPPSLRPPATRPPPPARPPIPPPSTIPARPPPPPRPAPSVAPPRPPPLSIPSPPTPSQHRPSQPVPPAPSLPGSPVTPTARGPPAQTQPRQLRPPPPPLQPGAPPAPPPRPPVAPPGASTVTPPQLPMAAGGQTVGQVIQVLERELQAMEARAGKAQARAEHGMLDAVALSVEHSLVSEGLDVISSKLSALSAPPQLSLTVRSMTSRVDKLTALLQKLHYKHLRNAKPKPAPPAAPKPPAPSSAWAPAPPTAKPPPLAPAPPFGPRPPPLPSSAPMPAPRPPPGPHSPQALPPQANIAPRPPVSTPSPLPSQPPRPPPQPSMDPRVQTVAPDAAPACTQAPHPPTEARPAPPASPPSTVPQPPTGNAQPVQPEAAKTADASTQTSPSSGIPPTPNVPNGTVAGMEAGQGQMPRPPLPQTNDAMGVSESVVQGTTVSSSPPVPTPPTNTPAPPPVWSPQDAAQVIQGVERELQAMEMRAGRAKARADHGMLNASALAAEHGLVGQRLEEISTRLAGVSAPPQLSLTVNSIKSRVDTLSALVHKTLKAAPRAQPLAPPPATDAKPAAKPAEPSARASTRPGDGKSAAGKGGASTSTAATALRGLMGWFAKSPTTKDGLVNGTGIGPTTQPLTPSQARSDLPSQPQPHAHSWQDGAAPQQQPQPYPPQQQQDGGRQSWSSAPPGQHSGTQPLQGSRDPRQGHHFPSPPGTGPPHPPGTGPQPPPHSASPPGRHPPPPSSSFSAPPSSPSLPPPAYADVQHAPYQQHPAQPAPQPPQGFAPFPPGHPQQYTNPSQPPPTHTWQQPPPSAQASQPSQAQPADAIGGTAGERKPSGLLSWFRKSPSKAEPPAAVQPAAAGWPSPGAPQQPRPGYHPTPPGLTGYQYPPGSGGPAPPSGHSLPPGPSGYPQQVQQGWQQSYGGQQYVSPYPPTQGQAPTGYPNPAPPGGPYGRG